MDSLYPDPDLTEAWFGNSMVLPSLIILTGTVLGTFPLQWDQSIYIDFVRVFSGLAFALLQLSLLLVISFAFIIWRMNRLSTLIIQFGLSLISITLIFILSNTTYLVFVYSIVIVSSEFSITVVILELTTESNRLWYVMWLSSITYLLHFGLPVIWDVYIVDSPDQIITLLLRLLGLGVVSVGIYSLKKRYGTSKRLRERKRGRYQILHYIIITIFQSFFGLAWFGFIVSQDLITVSSLIWLILTPLLIFIPIIYLFWTKLPSSYWSFGTALLLLIFSMIGRTIHTGFDLIIEGAFYLALVTIATLIYTNWSEVEVIIMFILSSVSTYFVQLYVFGTINRMNIGGVEDTFIFLRDETKALSFYLAAVIFLIGIVALIKDINQNIRGKDTELVAVL